MRGSVYIDGHRVGEVPPDSDFHAFASSDHARGLGDRFRIEHSEAYKPAKSGTPPSQDEPEDGLRIRGGRIIMPPTDGRLRS